MASIEKICEYSGEYPGGLMFNYKRNLIQIMPKYRRVFRDKNHYLFWFNVPTNFLLHREYEYCLFVPAIKGNVGGYYWNYTTKPTTTKRKLKRMLRAYKGLNIKKIPMSVEVWNKLDKKEEDLLEYI